MRWLLWLNIVAAMAYASFVGAFLVADVWIFPKLDVLSPPPPSVGAAIEQGQDMEGLRDMALLLFDHITHQAATVNEIVSATVFWTRVHFLLALGIACANVALLLRMRRSLAGAGARGKMR